MTVFFRSRAVGMLALAAIALAFYGGPAMFAEEREAPKPVTVQKIESAELVIQNKVLMVTAVGEVPTGGYTKPMLTRVQYFKQPDDGIQDYTFEATPPAGVAAQVISRVTASDKWPALPDWVKGVRIHGVGDGVLMKMLERK